MTRKNNIAFTIVAKNRLPSALLCRNSFLKYNGEDSDFIIFLADMVASKADVDLLQRCEPIRCHNVLKSIPIFQQTNMLQQMEFKYNIVEFCTSIKPFCIEYLMWEGYDKIVYIDPDVYFYNDIGETFKALDKYDCVLTPHMLSPMPSDGAFPVEQDILKTGVYNLGFGAWKASSKVVDFIRWWETKLQNQCFHKLESHQFVDQWWMGLAPCFLDTHIIKDVGYNCAYWNLHERDIRRDIDSKKWMVAGVLSSEHCKSTPLVFYHFSGLDYQRPANISKYQNRFAFDLIPWATDLFLEYLQELHPLNATNISKIPYYYDIPNKKTWESILSVNPNPWIADSDVTKNVYPSFGMNVVGYFSHLSGVGEVARNFVQKAYSSAIPYCTFTIEANPVLLEPSERQEFYLYEARKPNYDTSLFFVNLDAVPSLHPSLFNKRNIGAFWWEIEDDLPFAQAIENFDELLCFTKFMQGICQRYAPGKMVHKLPFPYEVPKIDSYNGNVAELRKKMNIGMDNFVFYFNFDYASSYTRKNILGVLEAFSKLPTNAILLIKPLNQAKFLQAQYEVFESCSRLNIKDRVRFIDNGVMSKYSMRTLMNMCDCYVSLHRSEGCGIGILDAMAFGKPVVATGYGGNMEFMDEDNSLPVKYDMIGVLDYQFSSHYTKRGHWAAPNISDAVEKMTKLMSDDKLYLSISNNAKASIKKYTNVDIFNKALWSIFR